jgi:DNA polymerase
VEDRDDRRRHDELERLRQEMEASPEITAARGRSNLVVGTGDPNARLVLIGEAPGGQEDRARRPFVGPAGQILNEALAQVGLDRDAVWITNAVKFRPTTESETGRLKNRAPTPAEVRLFRPWLERELAIVEPAALLFLGATAATAVLGRPVKITRQRGTWISGPGGIPTMPTYHPAYLLRRVADRDERFDELVDDLKTAMALVRSETTGEPGQMRRG